MTKRSGSPTTLVLCTPNHHLCAKLVTDEDYVTDKRFKRFVGACVVQILCGLWLGWNTSPQWVGFLMAALGALQIAVQGWSRRRTPTE
jgi:hypothetical protein